MLFICRFFPRVFTLHKLLLFFAQELCEFRDLLSKVAQLGDVKGDSSFSKGTVKRLTNRAKPTVSDAFRLQLQVLVTVLGTMGALLTLYVAVGCDFVNCRL